MKTAGTSICRGVLLSLLLALASYGRLDATPTVNVPAGATFFDSWACPTTAGTCHTLSYLDDTAQTGTSVINGTDSTPRVLLSPLIPYPGGNLFRPDLKEEFDALIGLRGNLGRLGLRGWLFGGSHRATARLQDCFV